jgi:hypothetical protein
MQYPTKTYKLVMDDKTFDRDAVKISMQDTWQGVRKSKSLTS